MAAGRVGRGRTARGGTPRRRTARGSAAGGTTKGPSNLERLAAHFGDEHWREVIRLFIARVPRSLFERFMDAVVDIGHLAGRHDFTSLCLREAAHPSELPFRRALTLGAHPEQRYEALQALLVLRSLMPDPMLRLAAELNASPERVLGIDPDELSPQEGRAARLLASPAEPPVAASPPDLVAPRVFISYATRDRAAVERLADALERAGIATWRDTRDIRPGDVMARRIEEGVAGSLYFVPVLSTHFLRSPWTRFEENLAWQREIEEGRLAIVPALLEGDLRALPPRYRQRRFVDLRSDFDAGVATLIAAVRQQDMPAVHTNPRDGAELVLIPGGSFRAGDDEEDDNPARQVEVPAFYLGRFAVTNAQYRTYLDAVGKSGASPPHFWDDERFNQPEQPVVGVTWHHAVGYCRWAGLRLPDEWEWEKGARGTDGRPFPWGKPNPWGKPKPTQVHANFDMNVGHPTAVGSYPEGASPYGLMDMAGNVWEWTASWYDADDMAPTCGVSRVLRGGSFSSGARYLRAAFRSYYLPQLRYDYIGFRCAQDP